MPPLDEKYTRNLLESWFEQRRAAAKIAARQAVNLNPLITSEGEGNRQVVLSWWWIHVGGAPAKFPAFNGRDGKLMHPRVWKGLFREKRTISSGTW